MSEPHSFLYCTPFSVSHHSAIETMAPSGRMTRVCVCVWEREGIENFLWCSEWAVILRDLPNTVTHMSDIWMAALLLGLWHKEYYLTGINKWCVCAYAWVCVVFAFIHFCLRVPIHVCASQCTGNKEIRRREGALKRVPTSQCHSYSLHLTHRNHNRGSGGIPRRCMTDGSRLKGNSTLKQILCTGGRCSSIVVLVVQPVQLATEIESIFEYVRSGGAMWDVNTPYMFILDSFF